MELFTHPLVRSVVVPLVVVFVAAGLMRIVLRDARAARWAACALGIGVLVGTALLLPRAWPAAALLEKLPWALAAAWVLGAAVAGFTASGRIAWTAMAVLWAVLAWWLGGTGSSTWAAMLIGAVVLAALARADEAQATAVSALTMAAVALGVTAFAAGSLLLMQLALVLAAASGGIALWLWPRARLNVPAGAAMAAGMSWLLLALATGVLTPAPKGALLLLALALAVAALVAWPRLPPPRGVWLNPLLAALFVVLAGAAAVVWTMQVPGAAGEAGDDPYYEPDWK